MACACTLALLAPLAPLQPFARSSVTSAPPLPPCSLMTTVASPAPIAGPGVMDSAGAAAGVQFGPGAVGAAEGAASGELGGSAYATTSQHNYVGYFGGRSGGGTQQYASGSAGLVSARPGSGYDEYRSLAPLPPPLDAPYPVPHPAHPQQAAALPALLPSPPMRRPSQDAGAFASLSASHAAAAAGGLGGHEREVAGAGGGRRDPAELHAVWHRLVQRKRPSGGRVHASSAPHLQYLQWVEPPAGGVACSGSGSTGAAPALLPTPAGPLEMRELEGLAWGYCGSSSVPPGAHATQRRLLAAPAGVQGVPLSAEGLASSPSLGYWGGPTAVQPDAFGMGGASIPAVTQQQQELQQLQQLQQVQQRQHPPGQAQSQSLLHAVHTRQLLARTLGCYSRSSSDSKCGSLLQPPGQEQLLPAAPPAWPPGSLLGGQAAPAAPGAPLQAMLATAPACLEQMDCSPVPLHPLRTELSLPYQPYQSQVQLPYAQPLPSLWVVATEMAPGASAAAGASGANAAALRAVSAVDDFRFIFDTTSEEEEEEEEDDRPSSTAGQGLWSAPEAHLWPAPATHQPAAQQEGAQSLGMAGCTYSTVGGPEGEAVPSWSVLPQGGAAARGVPAGRPPQDVPAPGGKHAVGVHAAAAVGEPVAAPAVARGRAPQGPGSSCSGSHGTQPAEPTAPAGGAPQAPSEALPGPTGRGRAQQQRASAPHAAADPRAARDFAAAGSKHAPSASAAGPKTIEDMRPYFRMRIGEAASRMGISESELKRRCREIGVGRWPQRKLYSLQRMGEALHSDARLSAADKEALLQVVRDNIGAIHQDPNAPLAPRLRRLRQSQYKQRTLDRANYAGPRRDDAAGGGEEPIDRIGDGASSDGGSCSYDL